MNIVLTIIAALAVALLAGLYVLARKSNTGSAPGLIDGKLAACPSTPNCVSSETCADTSHSIAPFPLGVWEALPNAIGELGGVIVMIDETYLAAEFASPLLKFIDDVEFRLGENAVHVRSASRVGHGDMGANKKRIEAIRTAIER
ncbi:DUF1499 domain-containing protein [Hyphococcus sp.]|uniref:DUF1499 domain-containing protein n=1 Tax=Hyphococcus sp. TaxID=2038636 RepID=UPI003CCBCE53